MVLQNVTSVLWLSLERYYNQGMTPERAKELIEKIPDPGSTFGALLRCESAHFNGNWNVETGTRDIRQIEIIVEDIERVLDQEMRAIRQDFSHEEEIYTNRYQSPCCCSDDISDLSDERAEQGLERCPVCNREIDLYSHDESIVPEDKPVIM